MALEADLVLGMSGSHVARVVALAEDATVALLGDFATDSPLRGPSVPDPFGGPVEVYRETFRSLEALVSDALDRLPSLLDAREERS
jgi:protein-tyrosine phosphatase